MLVPIITILALNLSPEAVEAFMERAGDAESDEALVRLYAPLRQTIGVLFDGSPLGVGIGATHPAALTITGAEFPWWLPLELFTEDEMARVTVELGPIGLLLTYSLRFLIAVFALHCAISFKDPAYRALGIVLMVFVALGLISPIMLNVTLGLYYWGSLGLLLTMWQLEQSRGMETGKIVARGADQTKNLKPVMPIAGAARRRW